MKLVMLDNDGKVIDSYEDIEEYDLDDPDTPFGLITWLKKTVKAGTMTHPMRGAYPMSNLSSVPTEDYKKGYIQQVIDSIRGIQGQISRYRDDVGGDEDAGEAYSYLDSAVDSLGRVFD